MRHSVVLALSYNPQIAAVIAGAIDGLTCLPDLTDEEKESVEIDKRLGAFEAQDAIFMAMFKSLPVGRRYRIAMSHLRWAATKAGHDQTDVIRERRSEFKLCAKWATEDATKTEAVEAAVQMTHETTANEG